MEYRIVKKASSDKPYREPDFDRLSKILECMEKEDPVREVHLQANHRIYDEGGIERLTAPARLIYLVQKFDLEMVNGGIHQYFCNSSGKYAREAVTALKAIGAEISASILNEAINLLDLDDVALQDRMLRYETIEGKDLSEQFDELDNRYEQNVHSFPDEPTEPENIWKLCLAFMQQHVESPIDAVIS